MWLRVDVCVSPYVSPYKRLKKLFKKRLKKLRKQERDKIKLGDNPLQRNYVGNVRNSSDRCQFLYDLIYFSI